MMWNAEHQWWEDWFNAWLDIGIQYKRDLQNRRWNKAMGWT